MKRQWLSAFLAGFLTATLGLGLLIALTDTRAAEAQLPEMPFEQVQLMRSMDDSLKSIASSLKEIARKP